MHLDVPLRVIRLDADDTTVDKLVAEGVTVVNKEDFKEIKKADINS